MSEQEPASTSTKAFFERATKIADTAHVVTVRLAKDAHFNFQPGQYAWVVLDALSYPDPRGERRALSIISPNYDTNTLSFLLRDSDSGFKKTIRELAKDAPLTIIGPFGSSFVIPTNNQKNIVFIAGGAAVAPFLGIVNSLQQKPTYRLRMMHYVAATGQQCNVSNLLSKGAVGAGIEIQTITGPFDGSKLAGDVHYDEDLFCVTGPQGFVNAVGDFFDKKGVPPSNRRYEENYPEPIGNLKEEDLKEEKGANNVMLRAVRDSRSHTVITDANGKIIFANPVAEKSTGFSFSEMRGGTPRLWGGIMTTSFYQLLWKEKKESGGFDGEITNRRKNGEIYTVLAHISPITNDSGIAIGYVGTEEDITERKRAIERTNRQNEELSKTKLALLNVLEDVNAQKDKIEANRAELVIAKAKDEAIFASIGDGFVITDNEGKISLVNKAFEEYLGWSANESQGKKLVELIPLFQGDKLVPTEERAISKTLRDKRLTSVATAHNVLYARKDGTKFPVSLTVSPILIDGVVSGAVEIFRDISREKEIDKAKSEFVSLASHQLRTPLSAINWYTEMLIDEDAGPLNADQKKYLGEIYTGSQRMVDLINSLLNVSRLELGTFAIEPKPTNIEEVGRSVCKELEHQVELSHQTIEQSYETPKEYSADPKLLRMIIQDLLSNSVKYTPEKGTIKLTASTAAAGVAVDRKIVPIDSIVISVSDSGYGIPQNQQDKIFSKLFRADNIRGKDTEGTGLGLYIIKAIVDECGGMIWFKSAENKGTTFYITLPASGMQEKAGSRQLS